MKIKGIPDGWELVEIGVPRTGDWMLDASGEPEQATSDYKTVWPIICKIEKPKCYRPFANAAEYGPFKDSWLLRVGEFGKQLTGEFRVSGFDDEGIWLCDNHYSYKKAFDSGHKFTDGSPFGVEVIDD